MHARARAHARALPVEKGTSVNAALAAFVLFKALNSPLPLHR